MGRFRFLPQRTNRSKCVILGLAVFSSMVIFSFKKENENSIIYRRGYVRIFQEWYPKRNLEMKYADQYPEVSGPMPAVILTYMRSGSSFFGEVLQSSQDVFYLFEPLRTLQFHIRKYSTFHYLDGKSRNFTNFLEIASEALNDIFRCNFENLPLPFFTDGFLSKGKKANEFKVCMLHFKSKVNISLSSAVHQCVGIIKRRCLESKHIVIKTIRIPLKVLVPFSQIFPKLKILHLVRDPRATLKSQSRFGIVKLRFLHENATNFCNRVYTDITVAKNTPTIATSRYFPISYENLAMYPIQMAVGVYRFLGISINENIMTYVHNITMGGTSCGTSRVSKLMCTKSANSSAEAGKWRLTIPYSFVSVVDSACSLLYSVLGLRSVPSEIHLRNLSYSLRGNISSNIGDFRFT